jgi:ribosomal protein L35AE/L33A
MSVSRLTQTCVLEDDSIASLETALYTGDRVWWKTSKETKATKVVEGTILERAKLTKKTNRTVYKVVTDDEAIQLAQDPKKSEIRVRLVPVSMLFRSETTDSNEEKRLILAVRTYKDKREEKKDDRKIAVRQRQRQCKDKIAMENFTVGDKVQWKDKDGRDAFGTILSVRIVNLVVDTPKGQRFLIRASIVSKCKAS